MVDFYINSSVYIQVLIASLFTWFITSMGASVVFFFKKVNKNILDLMLSLSAGIMLAASFFSLINPAIEKSYTLGINPSITLSIGITLGIFLIILIDKLLKNKNSNKRNFLLLLSITLHNIPEGLAIGVAFGTVSSGANTLIEASALALSIGLQNFPEGSAISLPLKRDGTSTKKSFLLGSLSGIVEPISALLGCYLTILINNILPYCLSFASGAMLYVVISELIPESQNTPNKALITIFTIIGFLFMMILDISIA